MTTITFPGVILDSDQAIYIEYTKSTGERSTRHVIPVKIRYGETTKDWYLDSYDLGKNAFRTFKFGNIICFKASPPL